MTLDRGTTVVAALVLVAALAFGPLVSSVALPTDSRADKPLYGGFADREEMGVEHRVSYRVDAIPETATITRSDETDTVSLSNASIAVSAGETPVTLRYQLRSDGQSWETTAVVPAGAASTVSRNLSTAAPSGSFEGNLTLVVTVATERTTFVAARQRLDVRVTDE